MAVDLNCRARSLCGITKTCASQEWYYQNLTRADDQPPDGNLSAPCGYPTSSLQRSMPGPKSRTITRDVPRRSGAWSSSALGSRRKKSPLEDPVGGCALGSSPPKQSKRLAIPLRRPKNAPSAGADSPRDRANFVRLALISRRRRGNNPRGSKWPNAALSVRLGIPPLDDDGRSHPCGDWIYRSCISTK